MKRAGMLGSLIAVALVVTGLATRTTVSAQVQEMRGVWNGFLQGGGAPPEPIKTEISSQENRRFTGFAAPPDPIHPISFEGTVSASGKVNIQGGTADGEHIVGKQELLDFGGGAAILNGSLTRPSVDNRFIVPCVLVMRAFAGDGSVVPNPAGRYAGGASTDDANGQITFALGAPPDPIRPTSFGGGIEITLNGETHTLLLLGTINSGGRIIGIAHKNGPGHMILDAVLDPPTDTVPVTLRGTFKFELDHGVEYEGTFEAPFSRTTVTGVDG